MPVSPILEVVNIYYIRDGVSKMDALSAAAAVIGVTQQLFRIQKVFASKND